MEEKKELTQKEKEVKAAKVKEFNEAFLVIKELVDKLAHTRYTAALKIVRPSLYGIRKRKASGPRQNSLAFMLTNMIVTKRSVQEEEIFKAFKIGRKEVAGILRSNLKNSDPENRQWIKFDIENGVYSYVSMGINPPANWDGYVPGANGQDPTK